MTQNLENKENIVSLETSDISKEIWPENRGKIYSKEELQKDETWKEITELFEFTAKEVILQSSNYWEYFLKKTDKDGNILQPTNFSEYRNQGGVRENEEKWTERKNQYITEIKEILSNDSFMWKYKESKWDTTFLNIRNTLRSITQLQRDFWKKFTNDQLWQITSCINKMQEKNNNTELIPANSDVYVYYNPFLIKDVSTISKMFSHITGKIQIDNCNDENIDKEWFKKNLKDTIESKLKSQKKAHICIMDHWDPYKNWLIEIWRFTWYLEELDKSWIDLSNLTISTFSCWWWEFQMNLYKDLKDKWCKTFPRWIYSQANVHQYSWTRDVWFVWMSSIRWAGLSTNIIWNWVNSEAQTMYTSSQMQEANDPMIQVSNTTIEQQIIKETIIDEELKNFLLNQTSFQIAEAGSSKNKFNNIS